MTNKEIGELRRRMKPDRTNLTAVYGCYVASSGEVLSTFREPFGLMAEEDKEKYLAIFRRALSGTPDRNLLDLSFSTKQVADSDEHRLLVRQQDEEVFLKADCADDRLEQLLPGLFVVQRGLREALDARHLAEREIRADRLLLRERDVERAVLQVDAVGPRHGLQCAASSSCLEVFR